MRATCLLAACVCACGGASRHDGIAAYNAALTEATRGMNNAAMLALWEDDGVSELPGMAPLVGKPAIAAFLDRVTSQLAGARMRSFEMTCEPAAIAGDTATERCHEHQVVDLGSGKPAFDGRGTLTLELHRGKGGRWRTHRETFSGE